MKPPVAALVWEIWRRNRHGLALLAGLLGLGVAARHYPTWLQERADRLYAALPPIEGSDVTGAALLDWRASGNARSQTVPPQVVRFEYGTNTVYQGLIRRQDVLAWSGVVGKPGAVRFELNRTNLYEGPLLTARDATRYVTRVRVMRLPASTNSPAAEAAAPAPLYGSPGYGLGPPPSTLSWRLADGHTDSIEIGLHRELTEEVGETLAAADAWRQAARGWGVVLLAFSFLAAGAIFSGAEAHRARGFTGIPTRRYALPVSTGTLAGVPMLAGILTVLALYAGWSGLVFHPLLREGETLPDFYLATLLVTGLVLFQALVWGLPAFPKVRAWLLTLLVLGLLVGAGARFTPEYVLGVSPDALGQAATMVLGFLLVLGVAGAWYGVRLERRGHWADWRGWEPAQVLPQPLRLSPPAFASPLGAQFWLEWRSNARVPFWLCLGLGGMTLAAGVGLRCGGLAVRSLAEVLAQASALAMLLWFAVAGLNLARDGGSRQLGLSSFSATRAVDTGTLLLAKLLAGGLLWLGGALTVLAVGWVWRGRLLPGATTPGWTLVALALSLHVFTGILPLCLSGRVAGFPWSLLPLVLGYGVLVNLAYWLERHPELNEIGLTVLAVLAVAKVAAALWGFRRSLVLKLVQPGFAVGYGGLWLGSVVLLAGWACLVADQSGWDVQAAVAVPAAILVLPLARIGLAPLALALNRHR